MPDVGDEGELPDSLLDAFAGQRPSAPASLPPGMDELTAREREIHDAVQKAGVDLTTFEGEKVAILAGQVECQGQDVNVELIDDR